MAEPILFAYAARTPADGRVLAIVPEDIDPETEKLYWHALDDGQDPNDLLEKLGYQRTELTPHPTLCSFTGDDEDNRVKSGPVEVGQIFIQPETELVHAAEAAKDVHGIARDAPIPTSKVNTFRIYARRGHGPKAYDERKRPRWVAAEVQWWAANRTGQGRRTDMTNPDLRSVDE